MRFNTAISAMMILVKHLGQLAGRAARGREALALLVSPFAPHLGEELWQRLGRPATSLAYEPWPTFDPALVKDDVVEIGVQVNGKVRGVVAARGRRRRGDRARGRARGRRRSRPHVEGKTVKKVVYVPGKILNFIVA